MAASLSLSSLFPHSGSKLSSSSSAVSSPQPGDLRPGSTSSSGQLPELPPAPATPTSPPPSPGDHLLLPPVQEQDCSELSQTSHNLPTILEDDIGNSNKENQNSSQTVHPEHNGESFKSKFTVNCRISIECQVFVVHSGCSQTHY